MHAMSSSAPLPRVLREFRGRLFFTYALFGIEMLASLLRPFFLGRAIDGLLAHSYVGLIELSVAHLSYVVIGTVRHRYDTRTFSAVYTSFVTQLLARSTANANVSRQSAHSTLARQIVDFLEYDFNYVVEAAYNIFGSLVLLFVYNRTVVGICLAVLVPVVLMGRRYGRRAMRLNYEQHDELERQVDIISGRDATAIAEHYRRLRDWQVRLSDQEAWNFGATELLVLVAITASLIVSTESASAAGAAAQVGSIVGIYNYILKFATGLETIPYMVQRIGALRDIVRRMGTGATGDEALDQLDDDTNESTSTAPSPLDPTEQRRGS
jgi:ABC-type multidrug transport system fused ATPase/permease subunit